ncbi:conserved hypothetical protein [Burkholderia cenocepacia]|nr:conserved hypothetical protein [Burkholderia cenocepacia]
MRRRRWRRRFGQRRQCRQYGRQRLGRVRRQQRQHGRRHGRRRCRERDQHPDHQPEDLRAGHVELPDRQQRARRYRVLRAAARRQRGGGRARQPAAGDERRRAGRRMRQVRVELHVGLGAHRRPVDRHRAGELAARADHRRPRHDQRTEFMHERRRVGQLDWRARRERHPRHRAGAVRLRYDLRHVDVDEQQLLRVPERRQRALHGRARAAGAAGGESGASVREQRRGERADAGHLRQRAGKRDRHADVRPAEPEREDGDDVDHDRRRQCDVPGAQRDRVLRYRLQRVFLQRFGADGLFEEYGVLLPVGDDHLFGHAERPERRVRYGVDAGRQRRYAVLELVHVRVQRHRRPVRLVQLARHRHAALLRQDDLLRDGQDRERRPAAVRRVLTRHGRTQERGGERSPPFFRPRRARGYGPARCRAPA